MSRILIAGCGDVGTALGLILVADGHQVHALRRNTAALPAPLDPIEADLGEAKTLRRLPDADVVFYTAAADGGDDAAYRRAYVQGVRNVLAAMSRRAEPVKRFFFVSSTGVYAQDGGEWVDESSPTRPQRFSGRRLLEGEAFCMESEIPSTVVRFGGIYGPGRERLIRQVKSGARCIDDPPQFTNRIHRDDCAGVLGHLMRLDAPAALYAAVDSEPASRCAVLEWLARRLDAPPPEKIRGDGSAGRGKRVSNARLLASGYEFIYPTYREGYAQVIDAGFAAGA